MGLAPTIQRPGWVSGGRHRARGTSKVPVNQLRPLSLNPRADFFWPENFRGGQTTNSGDTLDARHSHDCSRIWHALRADRAGDRHQRALSQDPLHARAAPRRRSETDRAGAGDIRQCQARQRHCGEAVFAAKAGRYCRERERSKAGRLKSMVRRSRQTIAPSAALNPDIFRFFSCQKHSPKRARRPHLQIAPNASVHVYASPCDVGPVRSHAVMQCGGHRIIRTWRCDCAIAPIKGFQTRF